jgi:hypothetical protein
MAGLEGFALVRLAISHLFYLWMIYLFSVKALEGLLKSLKTFWTYSIKLHVCK